MRLFQLRSTSKVAETPPPSGGSPVVDVLDADDVVFAEITARLHLDDLDIDLAGILEPVDGADRNVDGFVLVQCLDRSGDRDRGRAGHDDPMFRSVMVLLQG